MATRGSLLRLDMELAQRLAEFLPTPARASVSTVCDVYLGAGGSNRMEKTAKSVARCTLVAQQAPMMGDAEAVISLAQLLSGNFVGDAIERDQWGWHLPELWTARNEAIHLRFRDDRVQLPRLPKELTIFRFATSVGRKEFDPENYFARVHEYTDMLLDQFERALRSLD